MTEIEFAEDVQTICKRPKMYSPNGTFFEIYCFLDGFGIGVMEKRCSHSAFTPFRNWLAEANERGHKFPISLHKFRDQFSSDEKALTEFASLFRKYVRFEERKG
ncbi:MAG: hypothetical protein IT174_11575 [Acidobacteria bacterium]|nr:hypothetical protein [Acidobacteriota bacterium]